MKRLLLLFSTVLLVGTHVFAQAPFTLSTATGTNYTAANGVTGNAAITFAIENTNSTPYVLTDVTVHFSTHSNPTNVDLWYTSTSLSGPASIATPAWNKINAAPVVVSVTANDYVPVFTNMNFTIPGNTTYRFAIQSSKDIDYSGASPVPSPNTFSANGINFHVGGAQISGSNVGYGGSFTSPTNNPRWFTGAVTLKPGISGTCTPFTNFSLDSTNTTGVEVNWTPGTGNSSFFMEYGPAGFTPGTGTPITGTYPGSQPPVYIGSLTPDTDYDIYFGEICNSGADSVAFPGPQTVRTEPTCPPLPMSTVFTVSAITPTSAQIDFTTTETNFDYEYGPTGFTPGNGTVGSSGYPVVVTGLTGSTNYDVYVRVNCTGSGNGVSQWSGPVNFTSGCVAIPAPYSYDFEIATVGHWDGLDNCWEVISNNPGTTASGGYSWEFRNTPQTTSGTATGPDRDHTLAPATGGVFVTADVSGSAVGDSTILLSPVVDVSTLTTPELRFWYHKWGTTALMPDIHVDIKDGSSWTRNFIVIPGVTQTSPADPYIEAKAILTGFTTTAQVRFRIVSLGCCAGDIGFDDFSIAEAPACPEPGFLSTGVITNSSAEITFNGLGSNFNFEWGPTGFMQGTGSTGSGGNPYVITGLSASTTYDVYVQADCSGSGNGTSIWVGPLTFTTAACDTSDACNYFVDMFDSFGDGWNGNVFGIIQNGVLVDEFGAGFTNGTTFGPANPLLCDSVTTYIVVTTDGGFNDECSFDVITPYGSPAASFAGGIQFNLGDTLLTFTTQCTPPPCPDPFNVNISAVNSNTVFFNFSVGSGSTFNYEVGPTGFMQGTGTVSSGGNPHSIGGLLPNTTYDLYIQNNCNASGDGTSAWVGPITFTTACVPFTAPWSESFDGSTWISSNTFNGLGDTIDNCWDRNPVPGAYSWTVRGPGTVSFTTGPIGDNSGTGKYMMLEASNGAAGNVAELYTPIIDITALVRPELKFYFHTNANNGDSILVDVMDSSGTWNNHVLSIGKFQTAQSDPYEYATVDLDPYGDTVQVRFRSVKSTLFNGDMAIDDVSIDNAPLCAEPTFLVLQALTNSSATIGFNSTGVSFNYEYGPTGFMQGTGAVGSGGNPITVNGLSPNTTYDVYIQTDCSGSGNGTSTWVGPVTFTTLCDPSIAPYIEDFEDFTVGFFDGIENCVTIESDNPGTTPSGNYSWEIRNTAQTTSGTGTGPDRDNTLAPAIGGKFVTADVSGSNVGDESRLYTPLVDITSLVAPELEYYYHMHGTIMADLHVDIFDGATWHNDAHLITGTQNTSQADPYNDTILDLTSYNADTIQVRFRVTSNGCCAGDVAIDDIRISDPPTCPAPSDLGVTNENNTSADIYWTSGGAAWANVEYGPIGFAPGSGTSVSVMNDTLSLTGLTAATQYEFYVRDSCGPGDYSFWRGPFVFNTLVCDANDRCDYIVDLFDTFGDGWNGAEITFYQNGIEVATIGSGFTTGTSFGPVLVPLCDSLPTVVRVTNLGGFPTEIGFDIYDPFGTILVGSHTARVIALNDSLTGFMTNCTPPTCPPPSNLTFIASTATTADISWTGGGVGTNYNIEYGPVGFSPGNGTVVNAMASPFTITSLSPSSAYDVYVRDSCGAGDVSVWIGPISFNTACVTVTAPYVWDFEGSTVGHWDGTDVCWDYISNNPGTTSSGGYSWEVRNTPQTTSGTGTGPDRDHTLAPATGGKFVTADVSGSTSGVDSTIIVSPMVDISALTVPELSFWYHKWGTNMPDLNVDVYDGVMWHRNFVVISGVTQTSPSDPYLESKTDLSGLMADSVQVRFRILSLGCCQGDIAIDDFSVAEGPTCPTPTGFALASSTSTSATLGWNASGNALSYIIEYGAPGFTQGQGTIVTSTTNSAVINGLPQNNTAQEAYLRAFCGVGDSSAWVGPITFFPTPVPCDNLEAYNTGLIQGQSALFLGWGGAGGDAEVSTAQSVSGSQSLHIFDSGTNGFSDIVAYFDTIDNGAWEIGFNMYVPTGKAGYFNVQQNHNLTNPVAPLNLWGGEVYFKADGTGEVQYSTGSIVAGTFTYTQGQWNAVSMVVDLANDTIWLKLNGTSTGVGYQYSLANAGGPLQFNGVNFFSGVLGTDQADYFVDDFCVPPYSANGCASPTLLSAVNITCTSADLTWTSAAGKQSLVEYGLAGYARGTGTKVNYVTSPQSITGLTANTNYDFYVADTCGNDTSAWVKSSFKTANGPITAAFTAVPGLPTAIDLTVAFDASASVGATSYSWDFGDGNTGTGVTTNHTYTANSSYTVKLTITGPCGTNTLSKIVDVQGINIEENIISRSLSVYPNPTAGQIRVTFETASSEDVSLSIQDLSGKNVLRFEESNTNGRFDNYVDISKLARGVYMLKIESGSMKAFKRIVKQ